MIPQIKILTEKKLTGKCLTMSFSNNRTVELWRSFMLRQHEIKSRIGAERYSMQVYKPGYFEPFNPASEFSKWAAVEVTDFNETPEGMESIILPGGMYAVFLYQGPASEGPKVFRYIFQEWLPQSGYRLDERPHFEVLGEKYKNDDPASEEEIWIPIKN